MSQQVIMLALDGVPIRMLSIQIAPKMEIKTEDKSGQASGTATTEKGIKAKELAISGLIPYQDKALLSQLWKMAEAKGAGGAGQVYRIACAEAQAINMRQGIFSGSIDANPQTDKLAWLVNFTLREQVSVAEKAAARTASKGTTTQTATGTTTASGENTGEGENELTSFEKVLKNIDAKLGAL